jgi:TP901 family phage tail tape measure protein
MLNLQLAEAFVDIVVTTSSFQAGVATVIAGLGKVGAAQASAASRGQAAALAQARATIAASSQAFLAQERDAARAADAAIREARKAGDATERTYDRAILAAERAANARARAEAKVEDAAIRAAKRAGDATERAYDRAAAGADKAAARAAAGGGPLGRGATSFGMGLLQGLGVGGFAMNPAMMAGQVIGAGVANAVGAVKEGLVASVETAMDLQGTFVNLQRVTGESAGNIDKFRKITFDIASTQAGVTHKDVTDIATAAAKAGVVDKEGMGGLETFTRSMAKVKNALGDKEGLNTEQMTEEMTRMLNLFGKGSDYIESFGSQLVRMANISTASAAGILEVNKGLSGTFASLRMSIPEMNAFSSVTADVALTDAQASSSFSQMFRMMASQSAKFADIIGVPVANFQEMVRTNAMGAMKLLIDKFKELNTVDPIRAQEFLVEFGFRGVRTAGALQQVSTMIDEVGARTRIAQEEERTHGALLAANELNAQKAQAGFDKLKTALIELGGAIGDPLLPMVSSLTGEFAQLVRQVTTLGTAGSPALDTLGRSLDAVGGTLGGVVGGPLGRVIGERFGTGVQSIAGGVLPRATVDARITTAAQARAASAGRTEAEQAAAEANSPAAVHARRVAAIEADNAARRAAVAERQRTRFLPTAADMAAAAEEVGPAKEGAKGEVSAKDQKEHDEAVFRHAQRIQAERQEGTGSVEEKARDLGKDIERIGKMALGTLFAQPATKFGVLAGLAETGVGKVAGAAGNPLAGVADTLKGLAPDLDAKKKTFKSETFRDPADFARSAIQTAMSDREDKGAKMVKAQEDGNKKLDDIHKALTTDKPGAKNRRTTMTGRA